MNTPLLELKDLHTSFHTEGGTVTAVNNVSFSINPGETVCIVGESGCGKSVMALSIMQLLSDSGEITDGQILFNGSNLLEKTKKEMRKIRGKDIGMIFQEPMTSLNPVFTIGDQITETLLEHLSISKAEAYDKAIELVTLLGIPNAKKIVKSYPHELSGGMLQRIMIAIALGCNPKLLIADEPTTALDVTIQAQILDLLQTIKHDLGTSILFITHDLGVVAEMADTVMVMYAGKIVEKAQVVELFQNPKHPYTKGLLRSKPVIGKRTQRLHSIPGQVPKLTDLTESCYFSERCEHCMDICKTQAPPFISKNDHYTACWLYKEGKDQ
ncbi:ABC transporter ATP-binding protein [Bacillus megaterium]|nr:ABC transporter ATP-binding protein [Priestia megaterium]